MADSGIQAAAAPMAQTAILVYRVRHNPALLFGAAIVASTALLAVLAPVVTPWPSHVGAVVDFAHRHAPPSWSHLFGTDKAGRDILTRVVYGFQVSLLLVAGVLGISVPIGLVLGLLAAYAGGWVERVITGFTDIMLALPPLVMALAIGNILEPSLFNAMLAISLVWWTWQARLVYRTARTVMAEDFVEAARLCRASHVHIMFREVLPNCLHVVLVKTALDAAFVILFGATLSFLGLGVRPPQPDLGSMVSDGRQFLPERWWEVLFPGAAIFYLTLGFNLLGDGLRDVLDTESVR